MIYGIFKKVASVQIMVNVSASIALIVDNIIIGQFLGVDAVAGYGVTSPLIMILMALAGIIGTGSQMLASEYIGRGNVKKGSSILSLACMVSLFISAVSMVLCLCFTKPVCMILGTEYGTSLYFEAAAYLRGFIIGAPAFIGMLVLVPFMQLDGDRKITLAAVTAATIGDVLFDLCVVLVFKGDVGGIGLASSFSYYAAVLVLLFHFLLKRGVLAVSLRGIPWKETGKIFSLGAPTAVQKVARTLMGLVINRVLIYAGGNAALGAFTLVNNVGNLFNSLGQGLGASTLLCSGIMYGDHDKKSLKEIHKAYIKLSFVLGGILCVLTILFAHPIIGLFAGNKSADIAASAAGGLRLFAVDFIIFSLINSLKNYYQAVRRNALTYTITILEGFVFIAVFSVILGLPFGVNGVCIAFPAGDAASLIAAGIIMWIVSKKFPASIDDFLYLPEGFTLPERDRLDGMKAGNLEELKAVLNRVREFIEVHESDWKEGEESSPGMLYLSVWIFGSAILQYVPKQEKKSEIDVCVSYQNGEYMLRIRDNMKRDDHIAHIKELLYKDKVQKAGFGKVFEKAHDIKYVNTLGLNNIRFTFSDAEA